MSKRPSEIARGTRAPGYPRAPGHRVAFIPRNLRVIIRAGDVNVADTKDVVAIEESTYPPRYYLARDGIDMTRLEKTDKVTFCPFKGLATYYAIRCASGEIGIAFDAAVVDETIEEPKAS
jgi:uncharacterized protein (DUF427 family)